MSRATLAAFTIVSLVSGSARAEERERGVFFRAAVGPTFAYGAISDTVESGSVYGGGFTTELAVGGTVGSDKMVGAALFTTVLVSPMYDVSNKGPYLPSRQYGPVGNHYIAALGPLFDWEPTPNGPFSLHGSVYLAAVMRSGKRGSAIEYQYFAIKEDNSGPGIGAMFGAAYRISHNETWSVSIVGRVQYVSAVIFSKVQNGLHMVMPAALLSATYH